MNHPDRLQLLKEAKVIFWDEFVSNHREIFESVVQYLPNCIFVFAGDFRQILPVIEWGTAQDIIGATIMSSSYWPKFETLSLTKNMRLVNSTDLANIRYSEALLAIGEGRSHSDAFIINQDGNDSVIALPTMEYFLDRQEAINWLYPAGQPLATDRGKLYFHFLSADFPNCEIGIMISKNLIQNYSDVLNFLISLLFYYGYFLCGLVILAVTNKQVDAWNSEIQQRNNNDTFILRSHDIFADCFDPHGVLAEVLTGN